MPNPIDPQVIIRMGSHGEKEYLDKTINLFDGLIIGANLVEATPGATATLILKFAPNRYYLDPMTYAYGTYIDPNTGKLRVDLDWIKSDQRVKKQVVRTLKRSYRVLAEALGGPFLSAIRRGIALTSDDFSDGATARLACQSVAEYQLKRLPAEFSKDPEYRAFADAVPRPTAIFAPYFYIDPANYPTGLALSLRLARITVELGLQVNVHAIVAADESLLENQGFLATLEAELPQTGVQGVWLWFSKFDEARAPEGKLRAFRGLVGELSGNLQVFNMHGGYFSLALCKYGMRGISHGIGYGEQKDIMPVIGQSTPTVRYYLPALHRRVGVPQIERSFPTLGVTTTDKFQELVCKCIVCKGVLSTSLRDFSSFGEMHRSTVASKRLAQTPAAAKRCRFHFLLNRMRERDWLKESSLEDAVSELEASFTTWSSQPSITTECAHLVNWKNALE